MSRQSWLSYYQVRATETETPRIREVLHLERTIGDPKSKQELMLIALATLVFLYYEVQHEATLDDVIVFSLLEMTQVFRTFLKYIKIIFGSLIASYRRQIEDRRRALSLREREYQQACIAAGMDRELFKPLRMSTSTQVRARTAHANPSIDGALNDLSVKILLDSGANISIKSMKVAKQLKLNHMTRPG